MVTLTELDGVTTAPLRLMRSSAGVTESTSPWVMVTEPPSKRSVLASKMTPRTEVIRMDVVVPNSVPVSAVSSVPTACGVVRPTAEDMSVD